MATTSPLNDVRVLDVSRILAGPFCGQILGDLGAEVIKVERPEEGDDTRFWGPPFIGFFSAYFLSCNRNKKAITLDLAQEKGREILSALIKKSDVLLENFRSTSLARLGLTPEALHQINPRLIVCSISGFGRTGPMSEMPGYDVMIQAMSGLMSITGPVEGPPCKVGVALTDVLTGLYSAIAILACLHDREKSGHGYAIDLSLLDCAVAAQVNVAQAYLSSGNVPPRQGNAHLQIVPYQLFETKAGWLILAVGNDRQFGKFCEVAGRPELANDKRFTTNPQRVQHREVLIPILEQVMLERTREEWEQLLTEVGVPHAPIYNYAELFNLPHALERGLRLTVKDPEGNPLDLINSPFRIQGANLPEPLCPPTLSQHTEEVLTSLLGMSKEDIENLRELAAI